jgi:hypothetical protein
MAGIKDAGVERDDFVIFSRRFGQGRAPAILEAFYKSLLHRSFSLWEFSMSVSTITNNISDLGIPNRKTRSADTIDVEITLNMGAAPVELGAPVRITETEGSSKVTLSVQSLTFGRLEPDVSTIDVTVTEINAANPNQSTTGQGNLRLITRGSLPTMRSAH